jgi:hypothetical protein
MHFRVPKLITALAVIGTLGLAVPAAAFANFGAIAVGSSSWGKAWNYPTAGAAKRHATHACALHGPNCHWVLAVGGTRCGAVNHGGGHLYVAFANSEARAEAKILAAHPRSHFIAAVCGNHA